MSRAKRRKSDADKTAEKTAEKSGDGSAKKQVRGKATKSDVDTNDTDKEKNGRKKSSQDDGVTEQAKEASKDVTEDETLDATPSTTEDPAQAAIATPEEGQQAKKKKKMADEKDGSMVRHDLKLPPPVPRPFCKTDFNSIARFLDADDVRKEKDPKHKRQAPPMITTLKNFCAMTPRPEAKGFKAYVSKVEILIRRAFAKPMRLPKFGSKVKLTDLPIDARMPSPVVCNIFWWAEEGPSI
ncbi:hypothetical protein R1sor_008917 [Riccia sorocarpa]|uniref:Uncharacterized protein n=1 Tax=Riccia sorocarpa TaxID=122646 RepID=A0ABD3H4A3_9MARC